MILVRTPIPLGLVEGPLICCGWVEVPLCPRGGRGVGSGLAGKCAGSCSRGADTVVCLYGAVSRREGPPTRGGRCGATFVGIIRPF